MNSRFVKNVNNVQIVAAVVNNFIQKIISFFLSALVGIWTKLDLMLIDFIPVEKLPTWLVWLDWCQYAYRKELILMFICWIAYCLIRHGYPAVG